MNASTHNPWPFDCNFESDLCDWTQVQGKDRFDWTRSRGSTSSLGTGPQTDHTGGTCKIDKKIMMKIIIMMIMMYYDDDGGGEETH